MSLVAGKNTGLAPDTKNSDRYLGVGTIDPKNLTVGHSKFLRPDLGLCLGLDLRFFRIAPGASVIVEDRDHERRQEHNGKQDHRLRNLHATYYQRLIVFVKGSPSHPGGQVECLTLQAQVRAQRPEPRGLGEREYVGLGLSLVLGLEDLLAARPDLHLGPLFLADLVDAHD